MTLKFILIIPKEKITTPELLLNLDNKYVARCDVENLVNEQHRFSPSDEMKSFITIGLAEIFSPHLQRGIFLFIIGLRGIAAKALCAFSCKLQFGASCRSDEIQKSWYQWFILYPVLSSTNITLIQNAKFSHSKKICVASSSVVWNKSYVVQMIS